MRLLIAANLVLAATLAALGYWDHLTPTTALVGILFVLLGWTALALTWQRRNPRTMTLWLYACMFVDLTVCGRFLIPLVQ